MGAALVFGFRHREEIPALIGKRLRGMLLFWLVVNVVLGFLIPVIDNWGHLGGLVSGTVLALALGDATFARRGPALAYQIAAGLAGVTIAIALLLGVENRMRVAYTTLADWATASEHLDAGETNQALLLLDRARSLARGGEPWLPLVLLDRARALERRGDSEAAGAVLDSVARDLDRMRYPWAIEAAERFVGFRRYTEAEKLYRRVLARRREPSAANNLAWLYLTADDPAFRRPEAALPYAERAVRAEPKNPFYLGTLGTAQLQVGHYRPALENLKKAVNLHHPGNEGTDLYLLAIVLARLGRAEEAEAVLNEAVSRFPDDPFRRSAEAAVSRPALSM
jgi:tetratricopeptide (TPR) repeat protein